MLIPKKLNIGDQVGIISTARKISVEEIQPAVELLEDWGLEVIFGEYLFHENYQFAGTIEERRGGLQNMIDNKNIKAIICARGGYGTIQIIDKINFSKLFLYPKWIVGYSDVTVLHSTLNNLQIASIHATMPINFIQNTRDSLFSLKSILFTQKASYNFSASKANILGKTQGEIVGGNLSILYSLLGSDSDIDTYNKILFIEDLDEYLYHIDRMIISLKRSGKFLGLKGLIVGRMTDMHDNDIPFGKTIEEIIIQHTEEYNFPICFDIPIGHLDDNRCIQLGVHTIIDINEKGVNLLQ